MEFPEHSPSYTITLKAMNLLTEAGAAVRGKKHPAGSDVGIEIDKREGRNERKRRNKEA